MKTFKEETDVQEQLNSQMETQRDLQSELATEKDEAKKRDIQLKLNIVNAKIEQLKNKASESLNESYIGNRADTSYGRGTIIKELGAGKYIIALDKDNKHVELSKSDIEILGEEAPIQKKKFLDTDNNGNPIESVCEGLNVGDSVKGLDDGKFTPIDAEVKQLDGLYALIKDYNTGRVMKVLQSQIVKESVSDDYKKGLFQDIDMRVKDKILSHQEAIKLKTAISNAKDNNTAHNILSDYTNINKNKEFAFDKINEDFKVGDRVKVKKPMGNDFYFSGKIIKKDGKEYTVLPDKTKDQWGDPSPMTWLKDTDLIKESYMIKWNDQYIAIKSSNSTTSNKNDAYKYNSEDEAKKDLEYIKNSYKNPIKWYNVNLKIVNESRKINEDSIKDNLQKIKDLKLKTGLKGDALAQAAYEKWGWDVAYLINDPLSKHLFESKVIKESVKTINAKDIKRLQRNPTLVDNPYLYQAMLKSPLFNISSSDKKEIEKRFSNYGSQYGGYDKFLAAEKNKEFTFENINESSILDKLEYSTKASPNEGKYFDHREFEEAEDYVNSILKKGKLPKLNRSCKGQDCYIIVAESKLNEENFKVGSWVKEKGSYSTGVVKKIDSKSDLLLVNFDEIEAWWKPAELTLLREDKHINEDTYSEHENKIANSIISLVNQLYNGKVNDAGLKTLITKSLNASAFGDYLSSKRIYDLVSSKIITEGCMTKKFENMTNAEIASYIFNRPNTKFAGKMKELDEKSISKATKMLKRKLNESENLKVGDKVKLKPKYGYNGLLTIIDIYNNDSVTYYKLSDGNKEYSYILSDIIKEDGEIATTTSNVANPALPMKLKEDTYFQFDLTRNPKGGFLITINNNELKKLKFNEIWKAKDEFNKLKEKYPKARFNNYL